MARFTRAYSADWERWGYETARGAISYHTPDVCGASGADYHEDKAWAAWLAGAERAGKEACAAGKSLEEEAAKIEDVRARIAFRQSWPDSVLVPEREQSSAIEQSSAEILPGGNIEATLAERGARYGQFKDQAVYADNINAVLQSSPNWSKMAPDQREALRIIANKIGRILNGDPDYADNWHDIVGYAKLVDDRLNGDVK